LVAGLLAGLGIAMPVGAVGAYLVALTARSSLRVGAAGALGVATADGLYAAIAMIGGGALATLIRPVAEPLRWIAAAVLLALAVKITIGALRRHLAELSAPVAAGPATPTAWRAYLSLLGMTLINPLTVLYFTALIIGLDEDAIGNPAGKIVFVAAAFAASATWQLLLACGGALVGRLLTGPRGRLATALGSALLITGFALRQLLL
jgi:threonine/homoserine/homoserine lactone efflux protein